VSKGGEEGWQRSCQSIRTILVLKNKTVQSVQANQCNQTSLQVYRSLLPKLCKVTVMNCTRYLQSKTYEHVNSAW
jgi:hypothetical protein